MGQTESTQKPQREEAIYKRTSQKYSNHVLYDKISNDILNKNFSSLETYSLMSTFENLSCLKDDKEVIEEEAFLKYLGFPKGAKIGSLLYRSFIYLATYPSPVRGENLLTLDGLIKAIAVYCDKIRDVILEDRVKLIFKSFAMHGEHSDSGITSDIENSSRDTNDDYDDKPTLKISSIDLDDDAAFLRALGFTKNDDDETHLVSKIPCTDMIEILAGLVWIVTIPNSLSSYKSKEFESLNSIKQLHEVVTPIVENMARYDPKLRNLSRTQIFSSQTCIKWTIFDDFMRRNIPNIFRDFIPFFYGQFLIGLTLSQHRQESIITSPHLPELDGKSESLNPSNLALLSWMLPEETFKKKKWNCLYSGSIHGFSMNRFSSHVFKYTGPTLMIIHAEENILIGAYITDKWRTTPSTRSCFGSVKCRLFELYPTFESFPASQRNTNYVYYNPTFGIGFGGIATSKSTSKIGSMDTNSFVMQLDNTLQNGRYRNDALKGTEPTYSLSATRTFFDKSFEVLEIEVFGLGGEGVREKQKREWMWEEREATKRQSSKNYKSNEVDKEILKVSIQFDEI
ncbi:3513_t:CDS:2 [Funneliformis geosporum]|uniref:Restriction of telomere capping protein 5 n=1 Tax=Funneliformis geosporum TaxID=1117311 RepID=A0A9W4WR46_9GLOM|nr:3513_t:CDS:2 [Funneliformis geosporum]